MKRLLTVLIAVMLTLATIIPFSLPVSADPYLGLLGWVSPNVQGNLDRDGCGCSGVVKMMPDGTIEGKWNWVFNVAPYFRLEIASSKLTSLTFPEADKAVLTGYFDCTWTHCGRVSAESQPVFLTFVITDGGIDGQDSMLVYSSSAIPFRIEGNNFDVRVDDGK